MAEKSAAPPPIDPFHQLAGAKRLRAETLGDERLELRARQAEKIHAIAGHLDASSSQRSTRAYASAYAGRPQFRGRSKQFPAPPYRPHPSHARRSHRCVLARSARMVPLRGLFRIGRPHHLAVLRDGTLALEHLHQHGTRGHEFHQVLEERPLAMHGVKALGLLLREVHHARGDHLASPPSRTGAVPRRSGYGRRRPV